MNDSKKTARGAAREPAHPLASALAGAVKIGAGRGPVLLLGVGSGRNIYPLVAAGLAVEAIDSDSDRLKAVAERFAGEPLVRLHCADLRLPLPVAAGAAGALSTHALLHGDAQSTPALLAAAGERLAPRAPFFFTLGSTRDPRFGRGTRFDEWTWVPESGAETGVPHVYFTRARIDEMLRDWDLEGIEEASASETAGRWAHTESQAATMVHWFVRARRR